MKVQEPRKASYYGYFLQMCSKSQMQAGLITSPSCDQSVVAAGSKMV